MSQIIIGACKVATVITAIADQILLSQHYFLDILVKFYGIEALGKR